MARLARAEVFSPEEVAVVHVMNRVVRRCFLLGVDSITGKNYDHRKIWIESQLQRMAACFGIDLLSFAVMSNHFHLILRSRPDVVAIWTDTDVARRWLLLCPVRKDAEGNPDEPNEMELNSIRNDPQKLATIRLRLSDIAWWMRLLCQNIAIRANKEDNELGRFWQSRFRAVRLLDESAILACAAYVDLNPIRAGIAKTLEKSDFTSIQRRIEAQQQSESIPQQNVVAGPSNTEAASASNVVSTDKPTPPTRPLPDRSLSPLWLDEQSAEIGPVASKSDTRCSDKGFLPIALPQYRELLTWTARQLPRLKESRTPRNAPPMFERMSMDATKAECVLVVDDFVHENCTLCAEAAIYEAAKKRLDVFWEGWPSMCGRITLKVSRRELAEFFDIVRGLDSISDWSPRYNVAPTTTMFCVRETDQGRELFPAKWGLIPSWAKDTKLAASAINAKSETVDTKPMFRSAFKSRRCLVVATGFYGWQKIDAKNKQPHYITLRSGEPMAMAGLWESWHPPEGERIETCTICTTAANSLMVPFHDRMPVILPDAMIEPWLNPSLKTVAELKPILGQFPAEDMQEWPVNKDVGNVRNQGEYLVEPVEAGN